MVTLSDLSARIRRSIRKSPVLEPPAPGVYHYLRENAQGKTRLHLRIEPEGNGLLLVNASRVYHLNPTATFMAYLALGDAASQDALLALTRLYHVSPIQAGQDYQAFHHQLDEMIAPDGACPIHELQLDTIAPFSARPSAPTAWTWR